MAKKPKKMKKTKKKRRTRRDGGQVQIKRLSIEDIKKMRNDVRRGYSVITISKNFKNMLNLLSDENAGSLVQILPAKEGTIKLKFEKDLDFGTEEYPKGTVIGYRIKDAELKIKKPIEKAKKERRKRVEWAEKPPLEETKPFVKPKKKLFRKKPAVRKEVPKARAEVFRKAPAPREEVLEVAAQRAEDFYGVYGAAYFKTPKKAGDLKLRVMGSPEEVADIINKEYKKRKLPFEVEFVEDIKTGKKRFIYKKSKK